MLGLRRILKCIHKGWLALPDANSAPSSPPTLPLPACSLYPLLREVQLGIDPLEVFADADWALLIGAKPRGPGMERKCVGPPCLPAVCMHACGCCAHLLCLPRAPAVPACLPAHSVC